VQSVNFEVGKSADLGRLFGEGSDMVYTRFGNPTITAARDKIANLEQADDALLFSSGMGAITTALMTVLKAGDHVVAQKDIFGQTFRFLDEVGRKMGIETTFVDATKQEEVVDALKDNTRLIYIETPSNPLIKIIDIKSLSQLARQKGLTIFVDGTFASPVLQQPLALGASLVLHSGTKFLAGHSDLMCGVASGNQELINDIYTMQTLLGNIIDPSAAWLLLRSLKTLAVRVERQCANAVTIASFLDQSEAVNKVHYPGLKSSPYYDLAAGQMRLSGGMLSFEIAGGLEQSWAFLDALELIPTATSLGGVETVAEIPGNLDFSAEELGQSGVEIEIGPNLIRLSTGIEDVNDLITDLKLGLRTINS
jgi:cystathionine beta-lyase/cystathionine gamma-synthase